MHEDAKDTLLCEIQEITYLKSHLEKEMLEERPWRKSSGIKNHKIKSSSVESATSALGGYQDGPVIKVWEDNNINHRATTCPSLLELAWDGSVDNHIRVCKQGLMEEQVTGQDRCSLMSEKRQTLLGMKEKMLQDL